MFFVHNILVAIGGWPPAGHFTLEIIQFAVFHVCLIKKPGSEAKTEN